MHKKKPERDKFMKNEINGRGHEISSAFFGKEKEIMNENSIKEKIMKEFQIFLDGTWSFNNVNEANSKEEAINQAMEDVNNWARSLDIYHTNQWLEGEEKTRKKEILILNLETGSINPYHMFQDNEERIIESIKNGKSLHDPKISKLIKINEIIRD